MITITLQKIKTNSPCKDGWKAVKKSRGGKLADRDAEFPLADVLDSNGLADTLWCLRCLPEHDNLWRKYAVWCARQVEHLMADERSKAALDVAWRHSEGEASDEELIAARDAACAAALDTARDTARDTAWDAARVAACAAACAAAWGAAWGAARDAACSKQEAKLRQILTAGAWVDTDPEQGE